jgi:hypothetical protein
MEEEEEVKRLGGYVGGDKEPLVKGVPLKKRGTKAVWDAGCVCGIDEILVGPLGLDDEKGLDCDVLYVGRKAALCGDASFYALDETEDAVAVCGRGLEEDGWVFGEIDDLA